jgi:hypothetical protein
MRQFCTRKMPANPPPSRARWAQTLSGARKRSGAWDRLMASPLRPARGARLACARGIRRRAWAFSVWAAHAEERRVRRRAAARVVRRREVRQRRRALASWGEAVCALLRPARERSGPCEPRVFTGARPSQRRAEAARAATSTFVFFCKHHGRGVARSRGAPPSPTRCSAQGSGAERRCWRAGSRRGERRGPCGGGCAGGWLCPACAMQPAPPGREREGETRRGVPQIPTHLQWKRVPRSNRSVLPGAILPSGAAEAANGGAAQLG